MPESKMSLDNKIKLTLGTLFVEAEFLREQLASVSEALDKASARIKELEDKSPPKDLEKSRIKAV